MALACPALLTHPFKSVTVTQPCCTGIEGGPCSHAAHCEPQRNSLHCIQGDEQQHVHPLPSQAGGILRITACLRQLSCRHHCVCLMMYACCMTIFIDALTFGAGNFTWHCRLLCPSSRASTMRWDRSPVRVLFAILLMAQPETC